MPTGRGALAALLGCGLLGLDSALFAGFYTARVAWPRRCPASGAAGAAGGG